MPVDARPFLTLNTLQGSCKCLRPELRPLSLGITGESSGVAVDNPTHTIDIPVAITQPPADLTDGVTVTVNVERGQPREAYTVLRNGMDKGAGVWTLYVRREDGYMAPEEPTAQPGTDGGYWGRTS